MKAKTLIEKCKTIGKDISLEALRSQIPTLTNLESEVPEDIASALLSPQITNGEATQNQLKSAEEPDIEQQVAEDLESFSEDGIDPEAATQDQLKSAEEPDIKQQVAEDLESFSEDGIDPEAMMLTAKVHDVSLRFVLEVAETLSLDRKELAVLRGFVQQTEEFSGEQLGRRLATISHMASERKRLQKERDSLASGNFGLLALEERLGVNFNQILKDAESEEKKHRTAPQKLNEIFLQKLGANK